MSDRGSIIYLEGVVVDYDGFKALDNLDLSPTELDAIENALAG